MSYSISTGALESPGLLLSYSIIILALHSTIILIITHTSLHLYLSIIPSINIGTFFLKIAKSTEAHRKQQKDLDNKSADALYDLSEDFRIEKEDREIVLEDTCQVMRASTTHEELHANFEKVLEVLELIQDSYRTYHGNACFEADKYPLSLSDEFRTHLLRVSDQFQMLPRPQHAILTEVRLGLVYLGLGCNFSILSLSYSMWSAALDC